MNNTNKNIAESIGVTEREATMNVIKKHKEVFSMFKMDLRRTNLVEHQMTTTDEVPMEFKTRRVPIGLEDEVDKMIDELRKTGVIRPSNSPWNFPIVVVKKKNGDNRMCVDYRALNAKTARPIYPIPSSEDIFDSIGKAKYHNAIMPLEPSYRKFKTGRRE